MLSRVADSLYWMSRYFERADHCARVLDANYNLMLNPSKLPTEQRWHRVTSGLGFALDSTTDPQIAMVQLTSEASNRSSIVSCIASARENASQVREQISSEMWERLNRLFHEIAQPGSRRDFDSHPLGMVTAIREGSYRFYGVTDATMNHDEGWQFIQLGKYMERACAVSRLLDAHFSTSAVASASGVTDDLDWIGLLASCSAFEAYCKVYTADLNPDRVAEFLLLNAEFPYTIRHSVDRMHAALEAIAYTTSVRKAGRIDRIIGQLRASLAYSQIKDIMSRDLHQYLNSVIEQCRELHMAVHEVYIDYPIESAFEA
jgi:uncharacterized alpha-E superfamily protein